MVFIFLELFRFFPINVVFKDFVNIIMKGKKQQLDLISFESFSPTPSWPYSVYHINVPRFLFRQSIDIYK